MTEIFGIPLQAFLGQLMLGLVNGAFYAMLSLGLAVILGLLDIVNFAHGALYMVGAFAAWIMLDKWGVSYWAALVIAHVTQVVPSPIGPGRPIDRAFENSPRALALRRDIDVRGRHAGRQLLLFGVGERTPAERPQIDDAGVTQALQIGIAQTGGIDLDVIGIGGENRGIFLGRCRQHRRILGQHQGRTALIYRLLLILGDDIETLQRRGHHFALEGARIDERIGAFGRRARAQGGGEQHQRKR